MNDPRTILLTAGVVGIGVWSVYLILRGTRGQRSTAATAVPKTARSRPTRTRLPIRPAWTDAMTCQGDQTTIATGCTTSGMYRRGVTVKPTLSDSPSRMRSVFIASTCHRNRKWYDGHEYPAGTSS